MVGSLCFYSTSSEPCRLLHGSGMVLKSVSVLVAPARHQTALRGRALDLSRSTTVHGYRGRLRNLSVPPVRLLKTTCSIPEGSRQPAGQTPGESRPSCAGGNSWLTASAQLVT